ncbi:hypothetical protein [Microbacterium gorillae]|uniref:hypothetical protein n=1 Tax=Microbacterium gorillae TaxID=1231063 RepID=UPI003D96ECD7
MSFVRSHHAAPTTLRSWFARLVIVVVATLVAGLAVAPAALATVPVTVPAGSTPTTLGLTVESDQLLAGETANVKVTATNSAGPDQYNATVVAVLPPGVSFVGPAVDGQGKQLPAPTSTPWCAVANDPASCGVVLTWPNISDLVTGSSLTVSFDVSANDAQHPVGSEFNVGVGVYANANERTVPAVQVPAVGAPTVTGATSSGVKDQPIMVVPLKLTKTTTNTPESEALRGQPIDYELTVRNAAANAGTENVVVVDKLPGVMTLDSCDPQYPCTTAIIEENGQVFTQITWNLGTLDAGDELVLKYVAHVDLNHVAADGSLTGSATRPVGTEPVDGYWSENTAHATGRYLGNVKDEASRTVDVQDSHSVQVLDLSILKGGDSGVFQEGAVRAYTLTVRTSEYVSAGGITVTDTLPDGLCPVIPTGGPAVSLPASCDNDAAPYTLPAGVTLTSVTTNADGLFVLTFAVSDMAASSETTFSYRVVQRTDYGSNARNTLPTVAGDSFTNNVRVDGTTTPIAENTVDQGPIDSTNTSSHTLETEQVTVVKEAWTNPNRAPIGGASDCNLSDAANWSSTGGPVARFGDLICFRISIDFPAGVDTRNARLTDFIPPRTTAVEVVPAAANNVAVPGVTNTTWQQGDSLSWLLGTPSGGASYVKPGAHLELLVVAKITETNLTTKPDVLGNLAKLRYQNTDGEVFSARASADFSIAPVVPLSLDKNVTPVTGNADATQGKAFRYTIDVKNEGTAANATDQPVSKITVRDALPPGVTIDNVTAVTPGAYVSEVAPAGSPFAGQTIITWVIPGPLAPGATTRISYDMTMPATVGQGTSHTNTAGVTSYFVDSTDSDTTQEQMFPQGNPFAGSGYTPNAPAANDSATITTPKATIIKERVATGLTETGNNAQSQATNGEWVQYKYTVTVPAQTTIFGGSTADILGAGLRQDETRPVSATGPENTVLAVQPNSTCTGAVVDVTLCANGALKFPATWRNTSNAPATFVVTYFAIVRSTATGTQNNTATLSAAPAEGGTAVEIGRSAASISVVRPTPKIEKTLKSPADGAVSPGETATYTLKASNTTGSVLYDWSVVDCIPVELGTPMGFTTTGSGTFVAEGTCAAGTTAYTWKGEGRLAAGASVSAEYTLKIPNTAAAGSSYVNTATISGYTHPTNTADRAKRDAGPVQAVVRVDPASLTKSTTQKNVVAGETVAWTLTATIPANAWLYDAILTDTAASGLGGAAGVTWDADSLSCTSQATGASLPCGFTLGNTSTSGAASIVELRGIDPSGHVAPSSQVRVVTVTVRTTIPKNATLADGTSLANNATIAWNLTPKTVSGPNRDTSAPASATTTFRAPAVAVAKSVSTATPQPGEVFTYTVTATSTGSVPAYDVVLQDTLPAGVVLVNADGSPITGGTTASPNAGEQAGQVSGSTITWNIATIAPQTSTTRTFYVKLAPSTDITTAAIRNAVSAPSWKSLPGTDGYTYTSTATKTVDVTPRTPKVNATKAVIDPVPTMGADSVALLNQPVTFRVTLTNAGTGDALTAGARDLLPSGWVYVAGSTQGASEPSVTPTALTWNSVTLPGGRLAPGQQVSFTYQAKPVRDVLTNNADNLGLGVRHVNTVSPIAVTDNGGYDRIGSNANSYLGSDGSAGVRVPKSDLSVTKDVADVPNNFVAGGTGTWTVTVTNNGPDAVSGILLEDTLDDVPGVALRSLPDAAAQGWNCTLNGNTYSCTRTDGAALASGASWKLTVVADIAADVANGTDVRNTATVSTPAAPGSDVYPYDPNPDNNTDSATGTVSTQADLAIVKSGQGSATAGQLTTWTITVTNQGPSVSRGSADKPIVVTDVLPAGLSGASVAVTSGSGVDCSLTASDLTCEIQRDLAPTESITITLQTRVAASVVSGTTITNSATVTPEITTDPDTDNNSGSAPVVIGTADKLSISKKIVDPAAENGVVTVTPGETMTYEVTVQAQGPSDSRNVVVTDVLPEGTTFARLGDGMDDWTASASGRNVTFTYGDLAAGESATLVYVVDIDPATTGTITDPEALAKIVNAAQARSDGDRTNVVEAPAGVQAKIDMSVSWTDVPAKVVPGGDPFPATLNIANAGPSTSHDGVTVITLPAGTTLAGGVQDGDVVDGWTVSTVDGKQTLTRPTPYAPGESHDFTLTLQVAPNVNGTIELGAEVSTSNDTKLDNNVSFAPIELTPKAALSVVKTPDATTVVSGTDVTWTIVVTNDGPSTAYDTQLVDQMPQGLTITDVTLGDAPAGSRVVGFDADSMTVSFADLPLNATATVRVTTHVGTGVVDATSITNTAVATTGSSVDETTGERVPYPGSGTIVTDAVSGLEIHKKAITPTIDAGDYATWEIVVENHGPSDAALPLTITDAIPAGMDFVRADSGSGPITWDCQVTDGTLTCVLVGVDGEQVTLPANTSAPFLTVVTSTAPSLDAQTITNTAVVTSPSDAGDEDSADVTVITRADLRISKTHDVDAPVVAGTPFAWTLTVSNEGVSESRADAETPITVTDVLPAGVTLADGAVGCAATGEQDGRQIVTCLITSTLAPGDSVSFEVPVLLAADLAGDVVNTASVTPGITPLPDEEPRESTDTVTVAALADLSVVKTANAESATAGEEFSWTIQVTNHGPSASHADAEHPITITDLLPAGVSFVSATGDGWTCDVNLVGLLVCQLTADLPVGAAAPITVTGLVASDVTADVVNTAVVAPGLTPQPAENTQPDSSTATTPTVAVADVSIVKTVLESFTAGTEGAYRFVVNNAGPSDAVNAVITDELPAGLTFVGSDSSCTAEGQLVTCVLGTVVASAEVVVDIMVTASADAAGDVENTATVGSETTDPDLSNNTSTVTGTVAEVADLRIVKTHAAELSAVAGTAFAWTLTVTNNGPSDSRATEEHPITVTDVLPAGVTLAEGAVGCAVTGEQDGRQIVTCLITSTMVPGDSVSFEVPVLLAADLEGDVVNTASVTPGITPLPDEEPRESTDIVTVSAQADLSVVKTANAESATAGEEFSWTIAVTNHGPSVSHADAEHPIPITDLLPAGVSFVSASGDGWSCDVDLLGLLACDLSTDLPVGAAAPITVTGLVTSDVTADVVNTAVVAPGLTPQPAENTQPDSSTVTTPVQAIADLSIVKTVRESFTAGVEGTYRFVVRNAGPSDAVNAVITDELPEGLTFVGSDADCSVDGQVVTCVLGTVAAGAEVVVDITVSASAAVTGDIVNTATVGSDTTDPDPSDNTSTVTGTVAEVADLQIVKSHAPELRAVAGQSFAWTLTVTNNGPSDSRATEAHPIVVTDVLPAGVTLAPEADCAVAGEQDGRQIVTCLITSTLASGDAVSFTVPVQLAGDLEGDIVNTASVVPGITPLPDEEPRESTDTVTVSAEADLSIVKTANADSATAGADFSWTVQVTNNGPSVSHADAEHPITVTDALPAGVTFVSAIGDGWTCEASAEGTVVCQLVTDLPVGAAAPITITGHVASGVVGELVNTASVTPGRTPQPEGDEGPDSSTSVTPVIAAADVSIVKTVSQSFTAGTEGAYRFTVTNLGPSDAMGVVVTDELPAGLTFVSSDGSCDADGQVVTCALGTLASGAVAVIEITVQASASLSGDVVNTAVVGSDTPDSDPSNNTSTVTGTVGEVADLSIVKTATEAMIGESVTYTLQVTNAGPSVARGVIVTDAVPASLTGVTAAGEGWTCVVGDGGVVTCQLPELAVGATATVTVSATVSAAAYPSVENTATVTSATPEDPSTVGDNTSTVTSPVPALSTLTIEKRLIGQLVTGRTATYEITVGNSGPTEDPGPVTVIDELPAGLTFASVSVDGASDACGAEGRTITCALPGLAVGEERVITVTATVDSGARGELVNTASVSSGSMSNDEAPTASARGTVKVEGLSVTGVSLGYAAPIAVMLLVAGGVLLVLRRRAQSRR